MAAAAPPCDDRHWIAAKQNGYVFYNRPGNIIGGPISPPMILHPPCGGLQTCGNKRRNNPRHATPAGPVANTFRVCDPCRQQGIAIAACDRQLAPAPNPNHLNGTNYVFRNMATGIHRIGRLCNNCMNDEIAAYHMRLYSDRRRQARSPAVFAAAQQKAANTCKCIKEPLCIRDREEAIREAITLSDDHAGADGWLEHLQYDPVTDQAWRVEDAAAYHALWTGRTARGEYLPGCRCGRDLHPLFTLYGTNALPAPVAMCTACSGVVVDIVDPRVTGWMNGGVGGNAIANPFPGNMSLGRAVPVR